MKTRSVVEMTNKKSAPEIGMLVVDVTAGLVVLVTEIDKYDNSAFSGTVMNNTDVYSIGHHSDDWATMCFEPFFGSVVLYGCR